jgi:hypothetical protein
MKKKQARKTVEEIADLVVEDLLDAVSSDLLAEVVEDVRDAEALANEFDRIVKPILSRHLH